MLDLFCLIPWYNRWLIVSIIPIKSSTGESIFEHSLFTDLAELQHDDDIQSVLYLVVLPAVNRSSRVSSFYHKLLRTYR